MSNGMILNARNFFDFQLIPSIILSDDVEDFILGVINSKGEVLAEILNDTVKKVAEESGVAQAADQVYSRDDFGVVNGKVDDDRMMVIVQMPENKDGGLYCCYYAIVYSVSARLARFFGIAKNESVEQSPAFFEFLNDGTVKNLGPIEPEMRKLMESVLEVVREK